MSHPEVGPEAVLWSIRRQDPCAWNRREKGTKKRKKELFKTQQKESDLKIHRRIDDSEGDLWSLSSLIQWLHLNAQVGDMSKTCSFSAPKRVSIFSLFSPHVPVPAPRLAATAVAVPNDDLIFHLGRDENKIFDE